MDINSRMIAEETLQQYKSRLIQLNRGEMLFCDGDVANYYYQIQEGSVKMVSYGDAGQEFIQGIFQDNDSFGEPALLGDFPYPGSAIALKPSTLWRLSKESFLTLLKENFDIHLSLDRVLCNRLKYKSMILSEISFYDPEHRLETLFNHLKTSLQSQRTNNASTTNKELPFTRQQLADMSGMRVETAIRTIKRMEEEGKLSIIEGKIHL